ncbi:unnamed protein product [Chironomus riparius]|uniref:MADF domain-containing protein n=1 Tax=Chironomus riparius TaxID=315576 RepID=A0A9N9S580_9DIPT|nr:unnamed protein product [Chironomus riparius]
MAQKERWNESKTKNFINAYLQKPALWDASSNGYSQKAEKLKAYERLMDEFGLTLNEVRNKIRIYRTTYMQEKNKEATIANYVPRLSWYNDMKTSFKEGQVKSFAKSPMRRTELARAVKKEKEQHINADPVSPDMHFEFIDNDMETEDNNSIKAEQNSSVPTHIIIEPFEEEEEEEQEHHVRESNSFSKTSHNSDTKSKSSSLLSSNELFLQSLKSTLDNLPDEKNMRARIKIQEVLYTIMYEKP